MERIIRSRDAMAVIVAAAVSYVLGVAFEVAAYATLTPANITTSNNFIHASAWLRFAGGVLAWAAVCLAGWELVLAQAVEGAWEVGAAALGTLLIVIGLLVNATSGPASPAANVVSAVGIAVWSLVVLSRAARRSLSEERSKTSQEAFEHQAVLWLAAAIGIFVLAIGFGFTLDATSKSTGIASGVLQAVGAGVLFGAIAVARSRGYLRSAATPVVLAGLAILSAGYVALAIVSGIVFGPGVGLTAFRVSISVALTIGLVAAAALGLAAWMRVRELVLAPKPPSVKPGLRG